MCVAVLVLLWHLYESYFSLSLSLYLFLCFAFMVVWSCVCVFFFFLIYVCMSIRESHIYNKNLLPFPFGVGVSYPKIYIEKRSSRTHSLTSPFTPYFSQVIHSPIPKCFHLAPPFLFLFLFLYNSLGLASPLLAVLVPLLLLLLLEETAFFPFPLDAAEKKRSKKNSTKKYRYVAYIAAHHGNKSRTTAHDGSFWKINAAAVIPTPTSIWLICMMVINIGLNHLGHSFNSIKV